MEEKIKLINRDYNVATGKKTLEKLYVFPQFPSYIGCTTQPQHDDILADLSIAICKQTGVIQLNKVLPLDVVYGDYHSEALGSVWYKHHMAFVDFLTKYKPKKVLEIGGSNGFIAKHAVLKNTTLKKWLLVEPTPAYEGDPVIEVIPKLFDNTFETNENIDTVVHSHTFEHMYAPREFIQNISKFMDKGGYHIFSVPNLQKYLSHKYVNWINFEHTIFLTEHVIDYLLAIFGFKIINKSYFLDHSIFYATEKIDKGDSSIILESRYYENKKLFGDFLSHYENEVDLLNAKINQSKGNIYLFGAHVFSQFLLRFGLNQGITCILDNSKLKQGKRLYGTSLHVVSPDIIAQEKNVSVILRAGAYQDEVVTQLISLNKNVSIL
jgi:hypothetical protein